MNPLIFKENININKKSFTILPTPSNYTFEASTFVDFICFPYIINEDIIPNKIRNARVEALNKLDIPQEKRMDLLFEDVPRQVVTKYKRYLERTHSLISEKPMILMMTTDRELPYPISDNVFCIRTSLCKSNQRMQDFLFPSPIEWTEYKGALASTKPTIGFCGVPNNHIARSSLLEYLFNSSLSSTNFIFRKRFWGALQKELNPEQKQQLKKEFEQIIHQNPFSVCSRGGGNYSVRFYETLRAGRIPVLLDSNMPLPFEDEIDWNDIIISKQSPEEVESTVLDWHANRDLIAIQNRCRQIWEEYLYLPNFMERLPQQLSKFLPST